MAASIGGKIQLSHSYENIISLENLCLAWEEFIVGKTKKADVLQFASNLMDNIVSLHEDLVNPAPQGCRAGRAYQHGGYESFYITDPKRRHIHKASVRDRLLHHAVYRILYPFFDKTFIADSYSCRNDKGVHKAINRFRQLVYNVSKNNTRTCWVLKCDIKKFFASIDHEILLSILGEYIPDKDILRLLKNIIESFETPERPLLPSSPLQRGGRIANPLLHKGEGRERSRVGLPLGNLTSQLFANVYLNQFDQWVKHQLGSHYYVRYADDFVFLSRDRLQLVAAIPKIQECLQTNLKLSLHPDKLLLRTVASGMDFLGWVNFPNHRVLRHKTKRRMMRNIRSSVSEAGLQSYLGLISHGNTIKLRERVMGEWWLWQ